jgi:two-component system sensor kinase FixL
MDDRGVVGGVLILNFASAHNGVFVEITALRRIPTFCGETFTVADGVRHPLAWVADVASLLFVIYVVDASVALWRRGGRRRAVVIGGSITLFILAAGIQAPLVDLGILQMPYMVSFAFMAIVVAMGYELGLEVVEAGRLSREVKADERRWRSLLENVDLAVVGVDTVGRVNYVNPFLSRLLGCERESLLGWPIEDLLPEREREHLRNRLSEGIASGPRPHSQWPLLCSNGKERMIAWSTVRLFDSGEVPTGILAVGADITERLRAESELQKTEQELEQTMRRGLAGELASALAHELNQPLAAILSNAQAGRRFLAAGNPDLEELREMFEDIARDDKRAGEVIHRLRTMLREGSVDRESCSLNEIVQEVVHLLNSELISHHASARMELEDGLLQMALGRVEIQQVLINLLMNALQAMADSPQEERIVTIQSRRRDGSITVAVRDRGPGIAADRLPSVFEPFVTTKASGLGMGLTICRRLVEAHGGWMDARNHPDGGAEFSFTLPVSPGKREIE